MPTLLASLVRPLRLVAALACACAALAALPEHGAAARYVFRAESDSYVRSDEPGASYGHSRRISAMRGGGQVRRAYLRFDVRVPVGETVTGAGLKLYALSRSVRKGIVVRAVPGDAWHQTTLDWGNAPKPGRALARPQRYRRHRWLSLDVGERVRGPGRFTFSIGSRSHHWQGFASRENRRRAPRLIVKTDAPGGARTPSRPGGGTTPSLPPAPNVPGTTPGGPPGPAPSGQPTPVGDLPGWRLIFSDGFDVPVPLGLFPAAVSNKWTAYPSSAHDTSRNGNYNPEKVLSVSGGMLNMFIHTEGGKHLVAAPIPKVTPGGDHGQLYGRYAVRFRADALPRYKTAWLLWPDSGVWPGDGEIDFPEADLDETISGYVHHMGASSSSDQDWFHTSARYPDWHTAVIEWTPGKVVFLLDGQVVGQTTSRVPSTSMHWVLQTETALSGGAPSASTQGNVQVDWVAVWARA